MFCSHGMSYIRLKGIRRHIVKYLIKFVSMVADKVIVLNQRDLDLFKSWNSSYCIPTVLNPPNVLEMSPLKFNVASGLRWVMVGRVEELKESKGIYKDSAVSVSRISKR